MKKNNHKTYIQDGHGSVTGLAENTEETDGSTVKNKITDSYTYDAYGILLKKNGDTDNDYLYTGEQYNESTGLYYLRARDMSPETGTFTTMDTYAGSLDNPVSLHKYLYANANPVMYTDPTGNFSLMETSITQGIQATINDLIVPGFNIKKMMSWANVAVTMYDVAMQIRMVFAGEASIASVLIALARGIAVQMLISCVFVKVFGKYGALLLKMHEIKQNTKSVEEAFDSGDPKRMVVELVRLAVSIYTLGCQCFTGDTIVKFV